MLKLISFLMFSFVSSQTVPSINVTNYLGRWYQVYSDFAVESTFENNSYCVTADYGLNTNNTISVLNRERTYNISGPIREIYGWAEQTNRSKPGELEVSLQGTDFPAPYWIYQLGPENYNGSQYEYSIVSDPLKLTLFVLTRSVSRFQQYWETQVLDYLKVQNFTGFLNTPIPTVQDGCKYFDNF